MRDYTKIEEWKLADDLTVAVYERTRVFPKEEMYGLTSQLRRASYSVPANIVEGSSREGKRDYLHFLYIARGSLSEAQYFSPRRRLLRARGHPSLPPARLSQRAGGRGTGRADQTNLCLP